MKLLVFVGWKIYKEASGDRNKYGMGVNSYIMSSIHLSRAAFIWTESHMG